MLLSIDPKRRLPLHRQIVDGLRERITSGAIGADAQLPSTRTMAARLAVHRSTVALAYQELWSLGYLELAPGRRPRVRQRTPLASTTPAAQPRAVDWDELAGESSKTMFDAYRTIGDGPSAASQRSRISFRSLQVDRRLLPTATFAQCLRKVLARDGAVLLGYGEPAGHRPLRDLVAQRLQRHGIAVDGEQILLTSGSQQAIDLVLRMLAAPGRLVAIEAPSYDYIVPLLRGWGLTPVPIPLRTDGLDLDCLAAEFARRRPALLYTMPSFQNPSGICTSQAHREALLALCERFGVPILEDGFEEEMKYSGRVVLPIKSMDSRQLVIYCGTFSKVLFAGGRVGWIAADRDCIERLTALRFFSEIAPPTIVQAALHEFCRSGAYDRHLARMHRQFRRRMQVALAALRAHISPRWAGWSEPQGGFLIWLQLRFAPAGDIDTVLAAHRVSVSAGRAFFVARPDLPCLRLSIASLAEDEIVDGVQRLARALATLHGGSDATPCEPTRDAAPA